MPTFANKRQQRVMTLRARRAGFGAWKGPNLPPEIGFLSRARLELAYFSGYARISRRRCGGAGVILRFQRVRPRRSGNFQPLKSHEITPEFLDRTIAALKRWNFDIVSMDEVCRRAVTLASPRRFVSLSFDGAYKDLMTSAYPVLSRHRVPFTVYVPTAFPDGVGEAWWLALEAIIGRKHPRLSLVIDRKEMHFDIGDAAGKYQAYDFLESWLRSLPPPELSSAINDLCQRYSVDLAALSREASMDWSDLAKLAADPRATIGTATVNYPILANMKGAAALREMTMGAAVARTAFHRDVRHFAFPFGDRASFRRSDVAMAAEAGFASAVSAIPGVVREAGATDLHALPRITWDGRLRSLRAMRAMLSGVMLPRSPEPSFAETDATFEPSR
jgi:peptidoglycan/xylan/chitin deacetylase (PgdA/CDA1 family)